MENPQEVCGQIATFQSGQFEFKIGLVDMDLSFIFKLLDFYSKLEGWERVFLFLGVVGGVVVGMWLLGMVLFVNWWDNRKRRGRLFELRAGPWEFYHKLWREGWEGWAGRGGGGKGGGRGGVKTV